MKHVLESIVLLGLAGLPVMAQTGTGSADAGGGTTTRRGEPRNDGFDMGWIGLAGLL